MDYKTFIEVLLKRGFIDECHSRVVDFLGEEISDKNGIELFKAFFAFYFSLLEDGNICVSLDSKAFKEKLDKKIEAKKAEAEDLIEKDNDQEEKDDRQKEINEDFKIIEEALKEILLVLPKIKGLNIVGEDKLFLVDGDWLFSRKHKKAKDVVINRAKTLFGFESHEKDDSFKENSIDFTLAPEKQAVIKRGVNENLIVSGGPGTGKTTSILFMLDNLLSLPEYANYDIYLAAPSGKASSRIDESLASGLKSYKEGVLKPKFKKKIEGLKASTIHRLLGQDGNAFKHNKNNRFKKESIFVIDEASMIDICLFAALLEAIDDGSRIYIMGDANQLPSVESGPCFNDLLALDEVKDHVITLDVSQRFPKGSEVYELAECINKNDDLKSLVSKGGIFHSYDSFKVEQATPKDCHVHYYADGQDGVTERELIHSVLDKWGEYFYKDFGDACSNLKTVDCEEALKDISNKEKEARILTAQRKGRRGSESVNRYLKEKFIEKSSAKHSPGELLMINKNNKLLDLYNGDSGVAVKFEKDGNVYFMIEKSNKRFQEGYCKGRIFSIGAYLFYPLSSIETDDIELSFAITIHKSQGSEYKQILVILPKSKNHPLLNRQIVYTAITRTKGNVHILSNLENLDKAKQNKLEADVLKPEVL